MDRAELEAEICGDFRQLPPNRQDCVVETARALFWAACSLKAKTAAASTASGEPGPDSRGGSAHNEVGTLSLEG